MKWFTRTVLALSITAATGLAGAADPYPSRPIRLVVGFPPGGGGDAIARLMAEAMGQSLKQPIIVENRPGAGATIAPAVVATAAPDGYTLLLATASTFGADKLLYKTYVKYDEGNFTPINRVASTFFVLGANLDSGPKSVADLMARARREPGTPLFMASPGGVYLDLIVANFNRAGVNMTQVNYKGGGPAVLAVMSGEAPITFNAPGAMLALGKEGKMALLGITSARRSPLAPDLPTMAESGLPGFDVSLWYGLVAPKGLPAEVTRALFDASAAALNDPANRAKLAALGYDPAPMASPSEFADFALRDGAALRDQAAALEAKGK